MSKPPEFLTAYQRQLELLDIKMRPRSRTRLLFICVSLLISFFLAAPISAVLVKYKQLEPKTATDSSTVAIRKRPAVTAFANPRASRLTASGLAVGVPNISSLSPLSAIAGGPGFTLTVNGASFQNTFIVRINGFDRITTFVDGTRLTTVLPDTDIASAGTIDVSVFDPNPTGGESAPLPFTVNNPVPTISSISPASKFASDPTFTMTVNGTNFNSSSLVRFNGSPRTTTFIDSTHVTAQIPASDLQTAGSFLITVFNPAPAGGTAGAVIFTVNNRVPTTTSRSPTSATAGGAAFTLTINGSNFVTGTTVNFGGTVHPANIVNSSQLTASITGSEITTAGTVSVTATNPAPGGGTSTPALTFIINNPTPTISSISPPSKVAGEPAFTMTVNGSNFNSSSVVRFNGTARTTTLVNSTQLTAQVLASDIAAVGTFPITINNPAPGGGTSGSVNLTVSSVPLPIITTLSPASVTAGGIDFALTVNGSNYVSGSVVRLNGVDRTTTFVSSTQLRATILAADIALAGTYSITVFNPAPGGTSNTVNLAVNPSITTISPSTVRAGSVGFTLTVNGVGFVAGTVVRFNGVDRSTTFIDSTRVTGSIQPTDIASVGTYPITVVTPSPASLVSNSVNIAAVPSISNLTPMTAVAGSPSLTLTVSGTGFVNGSVVRWNGVNKTTTFVNNTKLTASISSSDLATVAARPVAVLNPAPNNFSSNAVNFAVTNAPPATECVIGPDVTAANPGLINSGPSRSQLWRTDDNIWWGAFSNNTDGIYFYKRVNPTTWTQGALIDTNMVVGVFVAGAPDALWTGTNLFLMIQESQTLAKLYKYTYNSATQTYAVVSGFPINIPLFGIGTSGGGKVFGTLAIEQDSTGRLWGSYTGGGIGGDGNIRVIYSTSADHSTWDTNGFILASGLSTLKTEGASIVRFGGNKIGVAWSNLNASQNSFRFHNDASSVTTWSTAETIDSGLGPEGTGAVSGKQITLKAHPDGRIFMVSDDNDGVNGHLHLYIRSAAGVWGNKTLVVGDFTSMPSKGTLLLDTDNSTVQVIYKDSKITTNGLGGQTFITQASMTNPAFNEPCLFLDTSDDAGVQSTSNPTTTKQTINANTDLVVAASTGRAGNRVLTNTVDITPNVLTVFKISPASVTAGESTFTLTVTGKLFNSGSVVLFNGSNQTTTFVNVSKLTASIPGSAITTAGTYPVIVRNSIPTVDSNTKNVVVTATNPTPTLGLIMPNREPAGSPEITITLFGTGFRRSSEVRFNGSNRTTQFISDTQLTATIPASDMLVPGPYPITVFNPTPGGGSSTPTPVTTFYVVPTCTPPLGQNISGVTMFNTVKSQMWYNDGLWWGAFSDNQAGVYFYKQTGNTFTKGALLDNNLNGRPDVLWNGTNLFVMVYHFNTLAKLYKYSYNTITDTYALISGFPISLPLTGIGPGLSAAEVGSITIAEDSTGKLWAAYPGSFIGGDGNYRVIWSTSPDHKIWDTTGLIFDTGASVGTQEVAPIIHFGGDKIGIVYSRQPTKEILFRYHVDGAPETIWSTTEIADSGLGHIGVGGVADNHMSLRAAPDGRLFLAAKDGDFPFGYINLYVRSAAGVWSNPTLIDIDPHSAVTRPSLVLDLENSEVYVFYSDATSNYMYMNKTSMTNPVFPPACPYVSYPAVWDSTSTKQNVKASMGLWAVGSTGGPSSAIHFNPVTLAAGSGNVPVLSSLSPAGVAPNMGAATLTIHGSNFASDAVVYFNGSDRPTTFVSPTQLTVRIFAQDVVTSGDYPITVMNPRGGTSATLNLVVGAVVTSFSPSTATAGDPGFTLTVDGIGFINGATVNFNGVVRPATFVNSTRLTTQILDTEIQTFGYFPVTVVNPGGVKSSHLDFIVNNIVPNLTAISPSAQNVGAGAFTLTVNGTNFNTSSVVSCNGLARATTFISSSQLLAQILASDLATGGMFPIAVTNPAPGGGTSAALPFSVINPVPAISSLSPTIRLAGTGGFTLIVNGSNFVVNGSIVRFNGVNRATTFVNSTRLIAQIGAADVQATGIYPITVFNIAPGGGTSNASNFIVNNPIPTISNLLPASKLAGDAAFMLTVNGTSFVSNSVVRLNGSDRATAFVSSTQLTALLTAADVGAAGSLLITVFNPTPGGGTSGATTLTVNNPVPTLSNISPSSVTQGEAAFELTVNGTNFNSSSIVRLSGTNRVTTLVNSTRLVAQITAADVQAGGTFPITVFSPTPGGGTSAAVSLTVNNPVPTVTDILPATKSAGEAAFTLSVNGTNFNGSSLVRFNGGDRTTTFVNATQLTAQITAADVATGGTPAITVFNPSPGGGTSNAATLTINNGVPTLTNISPVSRTAGNSSFTLTVNGTGFVNGSVVLFNGNNRTTTFVNSTQITASITAADQAVAGIFPITVFNPTPGGGTSNAFDLTVNNPAPTLATISPNTKNPGDAAFTLTVNGTNFNSSSVVLWGAAARTTTLVSSTQITAQITAADVAVVGAFPVTVINPAPGGGTTTAVNLAVNNPAPTLTTISPNTKTAGDAAFTLTVNGTNFNSNSIARLSGSNRVTTLVSATQLTAQITAADVQAGGIFPITIFNPAPVGGTSTAANLTVNNLVPTLTDILPNSKLAGDAAFVLTVNGTNFVNTSVVRLNGSNRATTFVSTTQLTAQITAADVAATGTPAITVFNPTPAGGTSTAATLTVNNAVPTITTISPATRNVGSSSFTLTVNGTGFVNGSVVRFNGANRTTTFVSSTQLTASMSSSTQSVSGIFPITVFNTTPGGGISNASDLTINNSVPTLTSISPTTGTAGTAAFTLTVNGTNFNSSSLVHWAGAARTTTLVSSSQVTAQITAADIAAGGIFPVTVLNPAPGGGTTTATNLTVSNPAPTLTSISPTSKAAGDVAFVLTVNGTNFNSSSIVRLSGTNRITTLVSATQLTAQITAADVQAGGTFPVTVFNPTPAGGTSTSANLTVNNPLPTLIDILPTSKLAGDAAFVLTVNGTNFNSSSLVRFNGGNRTTTFVSATQLTAQITAADVAAAGTPAITVFNPTPGGGTTAAINLTVSNGVPTITSISPNTKLAGDAAFTLTVNGIGFVSTSVIRINGNNRTTTFVNSTQLTASITAADQVVPGVFPITVFNPAPGGGTSNASDLTVNNPAPTLTTISPTTKPAGDAAFTLTVNGTNFNGSSVVQWADAVRTTTLVSSTQVTAQITAVDVAAAGTFPVTVFNPTPGGGTTTAANLTVNNPAPTLTTISPDTKMAGDAAFTLTVNGTNFNSSSIVRLSGADRVTTLVSTTQLTAQITAADVQASGTFPITVFNPTPAGGTSSSANLTVNNPVPAITNILPTSKFAEDTAFVLTVNGTNFNSSSLVRLNGSDRTTTLVSDTQLTAQITAADIQSTGNNAVTVFNPTPGGGTSNASSLSVTNPLPTINMLSPASILEGNAAFSLTVNGTNFVNASVVQWNGQSRTTTFVNNTQLTAQISAADVATAGTANLTVNTPAPGGGTSNAVSFTINPNGRILTVVNSSGATNSTVTVPVTLSSQGDEHAVSFSLAFDTSLLSNPQAVLGSDATGATLNTDTSQMAQGNYGVTLSLPAGQTFPAGPREIVRITFNTAVVGAQTSTSIAFTDPPVERHVTSPGPIELATIYSSGTVTITLGYEADVAPRPNGSNNGTVSTADWVQVSRFISGLDVPSPGSEFQRADCAPKSSLGNGTITITDWVQAGRYAAGMDSVLAAGGPTSPSPAGPITQSNAKGAISDEKAPKTSLRLVGTALSNESQRSFSVELETLDNENALGFSLMFDSTKFSFVSAKKSDELSLATLNVNQLEADQGRVGLALALPAGTTFGAGLHQVVVVTFKAKAELSETLLISFSDQPVAREVADVNANSVSASFQQPPASINPLEDPQFFVVQQYLDFLSRTADAGGLEYWTKQLRACDNDAQCLSQRRIAVSAAFFMGPEFQQTGYTLYRFYKAAFAQPPSYQQFISDRGQLSYGPQLAANTVEFANHFVQRAEFRQRYPESLSPEQFVTRLYSNAGLSAALAERHKAGAALANKQQSRAQVLLDLIKQKSFKEREYNPAFVLMQYFGYLRRDPDQAGYDFWLNALNQGQPANYQSMVCSFLTSREYQERFGGLVPRSNQECGP